MTKIRKRDLYHTLMELGEQANVAFVRSNDNNQEITNIKRTLKLHGEAHQANDILPQFTALCKIVDAAIAGNGRQMSQHIIDHRENSALKDEQISGLRDRMDVLESQDAHTCHNHAALKEDRTRIIAIEERLNNSPFSKVVMEEYQKRISELETSRKCSASAHDSTFAILEDLNARCTENEEGIEVLETSRKDLSDRCTELEEALNTMLKTIPEVEILKTQMADIMPEKKGNLWYRVVELERNKANAISLSGLAGDEIRGRIKDLEARMNCGNHPDMITRIRDIERWKLSISERLEAGAGALTRLNALEQNLSQYQDADRVQANRQAVAIENLQKQVEGLENRLSRAQDMIAEMEQKGYGDIVPKKQLHEGRDCQNCRYWTTPSDKQPCNRCMWDTGVPGWQPETKRKPRAPRTRDAGGNFAPKTVTPRRKKVQ